MTILLQPVFALVTNPVLNTSLQKLSGIEFFAKLLPSLVGVGFVIGSIVFLFMLIIGAVRWITSGSDKNQLEGARKTVTNALVGIVVLFSVIAIAYVVETLFGVKILQLDIPTIGGGVS
jgi:heme A synthase